MKSLYRIKKNEKDVHKLKHRLSSALVGKSTELQSTSLNFLGFLTSGLRSKVGFKAGICEVLK